MATANDIYYLNTEESNTNINTLVGFEYNFIPEIYEYAGVLNKLKNEKIEIKIHHKEQLDSRRIWQLASVWFEGYPVMVIQNAGREGDDYHKRFITDFPRYKNMVKYIEILIDNLKDKFRLSKSETVDPYVDKNELSTFYGHAIRLL